MMTIPVITIDGPSGVGKGTIALRLARYLGWHTLDSGALYRVLAIAAQQRNLLLQDTPALAQLAESLEVVFDTLPDLSGTRVLLSGQDVNQALRSEAIGKAASQVAAIPEVRTALLARQRAFRQLPGLVADGRDMGTVVFPDAPFKLFFTASCEERAHRRYKQLKEKGIDVNISFDNILSEIVERDERDRTRTIAPLKPADDAWIIDTSGVTVESVLAYILQRVSMYT